MKQKNLEFYTRDFRKIPLDGLGINDFIYCDPPYKGTKQYKASKNFNHEEFWDWCREKSKENIVLISEQEAPEDFVCIWEKSVNRSIKASDKTKAIEKLFIFIKENK